MPMLLTPPVRNGPISTFAMDGIFNNKFSKTSDPFWCDKRLHQLIIPILLHTLVIVQVNDLAYRTCRVSSTSVHPMAGRLGSTRVGRGGRWVMLVRSAWGRRRRSARSCHRSQGLLGLPKAVPIVHGRVQ